MIRYTDEVVIGAPVDVVWGLTIDVESWPTITPTVTSVERLDDGALAVGSRVQVKQPRQRAAIWTVTRVEPGVEFAWERQAFGVRMVATHHLEPVEGGTVNTLLLELDGRGARLMGALVGRAMRKAIRTENASFALAAEIVDDG